MDALRASLERYLDAQASHANHPSPAELLAYRANSGDREEREAIRDHFVLCETCRLEHLDYNKWTRSIRNQEPQSLVADKDVTWSRLRHSFVGNVNSLAPRSAHRSKGHQAAWLLAAASLLAGIGLGFSLSRPLLDQPVADARIIQVLPTSAAMVRGPKTDPIGPASSGDAIVLIAIPPVDRMGQASALASLFNESGLGIWSGEVSANEAGYMLILPGHIVPEGRYRLRLSWNDSSENAEYQFRTSEVTGASQ